MQAYSLLGDILTTDGFVRGELRMNQGRVIAIAGTPCTEAQVRNEGQPIVLPGFIDLHVHGGAGVDAMQGGDAVARMARMHARHGTTALLATTMTAPLNEIESAMRDMGEACRHAVQQGSRVLGVHLEGPYLSRARLGAQPDFTRAASLAEVLALNELAPIRLITMAPDSAEQRAVITELRAQGFVVQLGHSDASYEDGVAALQCGATGFTHLFNAMSGLHHRAPGLVGAALAHAQYAEIIPDLLHVHPGAIRAALRAIPGLYCVTDATAAAGMPDGPYRLGRHQVTKCLGGVRLADGTLAGSTLSMDQGFCNLVELGLSLSEASRRTATHAADFLGLSDRGHLAVGTWADVVVLNSTLEVRQVWVEGAPIDLTGSP